MCRARVILDQGGIKRLEATDQSVHIKSDRHALHRLSTPEWLADVHMPSMQLPKMQMPHMNFQVLADALLRTRASMANMMKQSDYLSVQLPAQRMSLLETVN